MIQENRFRSIYSIFLHNGIVEKHKLSKLCEWFFILNYFNSSDSTISLHFIEWPKVILYHLSIFCTKSFLEQPSFINVVIISFENVDSFHAQLGLDVCLDFPLHNLWDLLAASETLFEMHLIIMKAFHTSRNTSYIQLGCKPETFEFTVIIYTLFPILPASASTIISHHLHISTGWHPVISMPHASVPYVTHILLFGRHTWCRSRRERNS